MVRRIQQISLVLLLLAFGLYSETSGTFLGTLVSAPASSTAPHWIYVKAKNGVIRRVEISSAEVTYSDGIPREKRQRSAASVLQPGTQIRVTASQDSKGEWRASRIEILTVAETSPPSDSNDGGDSRDSNSAPSFPENVSVI